MAKDKYELLLSEYYKIRVGENTLMKSSEEEVKNVIYDIHQSPSLYFYIFKRYLDYPHPTTQSIYTFEISTRMIDFSKLDSFKSLIVLKQEVSRYEDGKINLSSLRTIKPSYRLGIYAKLFPIYSRTLGYAIEYTFRGHDVYYRTPEAPQFQALFTLKNKQKPEIIIDRLPNIKKIKSESDTKA